MAAAVPEDPEIDSPASVTFGKQALGPFERVRDAALGDGVDPHPPQPKEQTLGFALALGQLEGSLRRSHPTSAAAHPRNPVQAALSGSRIDSSSRSRSDEGGSCSIRSKPF